MTAQLIILVGLGLLFSLLNGIHDSSNIVATMISSRAMSPRAALALTALAEFVAPFIFGVAVATTIGSDLVDSSAINANVIIAALIAGICWDLLTWRLGLPSSSSHALVGGLVGAVVIAAGTQALKLPGLEKVLIALFISPFIGLAGGYLFTKLVLFFAQWTTPKVNWFFKRGQIVTAVGLAFSHGTNDAQKTMGIIALGLLTTGFISEFYIPVWVIVTSALAISLGIALGGWRLIRTLGMKIYKIRPMDGFCAQSTSAIVILGASLVGGPVSTTQVVSSAIMGVGAAQRLGKVRWGVGLDLLMAWLVTIPASAVMAAVIYWGMDFLIRAIG
jgi:inorganic phosphate transporter, PiT family